DLTRRSDQVAQLRRQLPWVRVDKKYTFDGPDGRQALADLFDGRRQLLVQHFMLTPGAEQGCPSCSYMADHTDAMTMHLAQRDVFHTYSTYGRGVEVMMGTYRLLDLTPKGRDERDTFYKMEWVRHHDRYEPELPTAKAADAACCKARAQVARHE